MVVDKNTIKCEAIFSDDRTHRFLWRRVWNKELPIVSIIMLNPCLSDNIITDTTTALVVNNVARLGEYGGVDILNLYSKLTPKLKFTESDKALNHKENDSYILKSVEASSKTIIAWGKSSNSNARVEERSIQVLNMLKEHQEKLYVISDGIRIGIHPLTPSARREWFLEKCEFQEQTQK